MAERPLVAGNWKMNLLSGEASALAGELRRALEAEPETAGAVEVVVCPAFTLLAAVGAALRGSAVLALGAQDAWHQDRGAFTGEVSPPMLLDAGCRYVVLGHSERRRHQGESDGLINLKLLAALRHGLRPILCVGETLEEREAGRAEEVAATQLRRCLEGVDGGAADQVAVAYEPVWAIGTGRAASPETAAAMHALLRGELRRRFGPAADQVRVVYGGSVTPDNAGQFMARPEVDGALVGGASLSAGAFMAIVRAARVKRG
ncbi:MAG: triose-phosphate isomerase [Acetobacteraceae bacterium]|nr:triose-phosphate isomerase [Acetobacteraceae bacterium]